MGDGRERVSRRARGGPGAGRGGVHGVRRRTRAGAVAPGLAAHRGHRRRAGPRPGGAGPGRPALGPDRGRRARGVRPDGGPVDLGRRVAAPAPRPARRRPRGAGRRNPGRFGRRGRPAHSRGGARPAHRPAARRPRPALLRGPLRGRDRGRARGLGRHREVPDQPRRGSCSPPAVRRPAPSGRRAGSQTSVSRPVRSRWAPAGPASSSAGSATRRTRAASSARRTSRSCAPTGRSRC